MGLEGRLEPHEEWLRPEYEQLSSLLEKFRVRALLERLRQEFWKVGKIQEIHGARSGESPSISRVVFVAYQLYFDYAGYGRNFVAPFTRQNPSITGYFTSYPTVFSPSIMVGVANPHWKDGHEYDQVKFLFISNQSDKKRQIRFHFGQDGIDCEFNLTESRWGNYKPYPDEEISKKLEGALFSWRYIRYVDSAKEIASENMLNNPPSPDKTLDLLRKRYLPKK